MIRHWFWNITSHGEETIHLISRYRGIWYQFHLLTVPETFRAEYLLSCFLMLSLTSGMIDPFIIYLSSSLIPMPLRSG
jgi:hypothetical protein